MRQEKTMIRGACLALFVVVVAACSDRALLEGGSGAGSVDPTAGTATTGEPPGESDGERTSGDPGESASGGGSRPDVGGSGGGETGGETCRGGDGQDGEDGKPGRGPNGGQGGKGGKGGRSCPPG